MDGRERPVPAFSGARMATCRHKTGCFKKACHQPHRENAGFAYFDRLSTSPSPHFSLIVTTVSLVKIIFIFDILSIVIKH